MRRRRIGSKIRKGPHRSKSTSKTTVLVVGEVVRIDCTLRARVTIRGTPERAFEAVCRIGGGHGYYAADWLWRLRGWMDRMVGGPGLRRGRRTLRSVGYGDALDFWRVTDVDALLAGCTDKTRIVYIANPNNPTGTMIGTGELARLADGLPDKALLVLDGAYAEYVDGYDAGAALVRERENVFMTRTFSKLYGLGGLRVGWGYGPQAVIDVLYRIRGPFNLSAPALAAAEAAIRDADYVAHCRSENARWRTWLAESLAEIGVPSDTSCANFILARFGSVAEAEACDAYLKSQGLIVRPVAGYNLAEALRITVGDEIACRRVVAAVREFKEGAR